MAQRLFHKSFQNISTIHCGQGGVYAGSSGVPEEDIQKLKDIKAYLVLAQQKYKECGILIKCPESIKIEIMTIRKNYCIEKDNICNMMKYIENRIANKHLIKKKRHKNYSSSSSRKHNINKTTKK